MKLIQAARFLTVLAVTLVCSQCMGPNEPFFRYNSPFKSNKPSGAFVASGNQPAPIPGDPEFVSDNELAEGSPGIVNRPGATPGTTPGATPGADTQASPPIHIHKRGPAGSVCYTCRGKGYVLQPTSTSAGDIYGCPACGGDGRN